MSRLRTFLVFSFLLAAAHPAAAQIKIGVTVSATGPAASLGIPERNAISLAPKEIAGKTVEYIILDDASDPTAARRNIERFTTESNVDLIIGPSTSPASLATIEVIGRTKTPMISLGASRAIIFPMDDNRKWSFKTPYNDATTAAATVKHMKSSGVKSVATIAFNDAYGEGWVKEFTPIAEKAGIKLVASELFARTDTSVTAQILKIVSGNPDAVLVVASGTPGVLPQASLFERNYKGKVYQTTGVVNNDFLRVGGKSVEGTFIAADPITVAGQLPDGHPAKSAGVGFTKRYDEAFGRGSTSAFSGYAWDAIMLAEAAIPVALKSAAPGTEAFRSALRNAIEASKAVPTTAGPVTMSADDHNGYSDDAPIMITVKNGLFSINR
ncbi:ABC transporter substrate-binding protein [Bradyrhizobium sp. 2]|uniref:ABC transporter substrate-binding protein n=1 Tax=unclassified Bradyrhizobium TaxID=2631580 RepID=UPI001FF97B32|nr:MULTISPECIES: ABC transporter substrate-binding protein [unclassified Bradyrhizobium]MCK1447067.1 ABC transporter substrate-binding protein [Bradyrhizobium sp. 48]MCK1464848.1 ABC transporter substrate-binding protein [Bradyrhizobium sp. 2]